MRGVSVLLLTLTLVGCSGNDSTLKGMNAVNDACKKNSGELSVVFEAGPFGNTAKVSCTARVHP